MDASEVSLDLSGRVAVVTGAAAGLGRAEAVGLAAPGRRWWSTIRARTGGLRRPRRDRRHRKPGRRGGRRYQPAPTADDIVACAEGLGGLDVVVNNAGITRDRMLFNMTDEDWDTVIAVHLRGHFLLTRNAAAYWRAKARSQAPDGGGRVYGRIINTSSEAGLSGPAGQANYGAAKAGITALTMTAAKALGRYGVRSNAICPRARTAMTADVFGAAPDLGAGKSTRCPRSMS